MTNIALLRLIEERADASRIEEHAERLRQDLVDRDLRAATGPEPGTLTVAVGTSPEIASFVNGVCAWLDGSPGRRARVTRGEFGLELTGGSLERRRLLIEWLMQHTDIGQ